MQWQGHAALVECAACVPPTRGRIAWRHSDACAVGAAAGDATEMTRNATDRGVVGQFENGTRVARPESSKGVGITLCLDPRPSKTQGVPLELTHYRPGASRGHVFPGHPGGNWQERPSDLAGFCRLGNACHLGFDFFPKVGA